jgi:two-component system sensor histidine kinase DegS
VFGRATRVHGPADAEFLGIVADFVASLLEQATAAPAVAADRPIETTVAEERKRFAQELHDGLAQELTGLVLGLESAQRAIGKDNSLATKQLARSVSDARGTLLEVRRYMAALRQIEGRDAVDLPVLLARLVEDLRRQTGLEVEVDEAGLRAETDRAAERALLRIIGEALRNVAMHSGASRAKVSVEYRPDRLTAIVQDDGKGFDADRVIARAEAEGHFGLIGMRERAEGLGGQLLIRSEPGRGTVVHATIPFQHPDTTVDDVETVPAFDDTQPTVPTARPGILGIFRKK